jgi:p25-alpha
VQGKNICLQKDCGILGEGPNQTITSTDCDIVFNKVKAKSERTIDFGQFVEALQALATKKFGKEGDAYEHLCEDMFQSGGGPKLAKGSTLVQNDEILQKLTDTSLYTGTHKVLFLK